MTRDDVHAGDLGPLSWTEQVRPDSLVRDLLASVNGRLPYPDGSRCWVAYVTFPVDRWKRARRSVVPDACRAGWSRVVSVALSAVGGHRGRD